jgi:HlyD family secretion protein
VTSPAFEALTFGVLPETIQNVATCAVVITVRNEDLLLKPGMRATIRIVIDSRDDVLHAANQALRYSPDGRTAAIGAGRPSVGLLQLWIRGPTAITVQLGLDYVRMWK